MFKRLFFTFLVALMPLSGMLAQPESAKAKVVAHRGYWNVNGKWSGNSATPQNSLAAYQKADRQGFFGSEFDVNMTSDGGLVVCHGPKIVSLADEMVYVPKVPAILSAAVEIIPLQLFAYYVAKENGCDIDKPKNLAKSVTVE